MFKKIIAMIAVFLCVFSLQFVVYAEEETITSVDNEGEARELIVKVNNTSTIEESGIIYSITLTWDDLTFEYGGKTITDWDPSTHSYVVNSSSNAGWKSTTSGIIVTNHSNAPIQVSFNYTPVPKSGVEGSFDVVSQGLSAATPENSESPPSVFTRFTISGTPSQDGVYTVGSIYVLINPVNSMP